MERLNWGLLDFESAHQRQLQRVDRRKRDECGDALVVVKHPHVITVGRRQEAMQNILSAGDVPVVPVERGGDATYHGPGQLVVYPILALREGERDLHRFLRNLEQALLDGVAAFGVEAQRNAGKTGIWIAGRKLASIGIACRRWVTFHGLALNVNTDLSYFSRINPCGFDASVMTSMAQETSGPVNEAAVAEVLCRALALRLGRDLEQ